MISKKYFHINNINPCKPIPNFGISYQVIAILVVLIGICLLLGQSASIYASTNTTSTNKTSIGNTSRDNDARAITASDSISEEKASVRPLSPSGRSLDLGADKFGIDMLYPSKSRGEEWFINMPDPTADSRFNPQDQITRNPDGSWKIKSEKVRMYVYTSNGYNPNQITADSGQSQLVTRGFMGSPNDWRDVEITGYVKLNKFSDNDNFVWYTRGGKHTDSDPCQGSSYKGNLFYHGETQFAKEQWHVSYAKSPTITATSPLEGKWIGFKFVMYNTLTPEGKLAVKLENWIDEDADGKNWIKVYEGADAGKWGRTGEECKVRADQILSWSGPLAAFRWDFANDVDFRNFSVREITGDNGTLHGIDYFTGTSSSSNVPKFGNAPPLDDLTGSEQESFLPNGFVRKNYANNFYRNSSFPSVNSGNGAATGESFGQKQVTVGNMVYVIWVQGDEDNTDLFLKISQDGGATFGDNINLSNNPASLSYNPQIVAVGESVYVVWEDDDGNSGNSDVFFIKSSDGGKSFTVKRNLSNDPSGSGSPQISVSGNNVYVAWAGTSPDNTDIMLAQSSNSGDSFALATNISNDREISFNPVLFVNGTHVSVEWKGQDDNGATNTKSVSVPNLKVQSQETSRVSSTDISGLLNMTNSDFGGDNNSTEQEAQIQENQTTLESLDALNQTSTLTSPSPSLPSPSPSLPSPSSSTNSTEYTSPSQNASDSTFNVNLSHSSGSNSSTSIPLMPVSRQEVDSTVLLDYNNTGPMSVATPIPPSINMELNDSTFSSLEDMQASDTRPVKEASEGVLPTQSNKKSEIALDIVEENALVQLKPIEDGSALPSTDELGNTQEGVRIPIIPIQSDKVVGEHKETAKESRQDDGQLELVQQEQQEQQKQEADEQGRLQQQGQEKRQDQYQQRKEIGNKKTSSTQQTDLSQSQNKDSQKDSTSQKQAETARERAQVQVQLQQEMQQREQQQQQQQQLIQQQQQLIRQQGIEVQKKIAREAELEARNQVLNLIRDANEAFENAGRMIAQAKAADQKAQAAIAEFSSHKSGLEIQGQDQGQGQEGETKEILPQEIMKLISEAKFAQQIAQEASEKYNDLRKAADTSVSEFNAKFH